VSRCGRVADAAVVADGLSARVAVWGVARMGSGVACPVATIVVSCVRGRPVHGLCGTGVVSGICLVQGLFPNNAAIAAPDLVRRARCGACLSKGDQQEGKNEGECKHRAISDTPPIGLAWRMLLSFVRLASRTTGHNGLRTRSPRLRVRVIAYCRPAGLIRL